MERRIWTALSSLITSIDRSFDNALYTHSVGRVVRMLMWSVLNDRPMHWACDRRNWAGVKPPAELLSQSRLSRRLRFPDTQQFLQQLFDHLRDDERLNDAAAALAKYIDGKPLVVARHTRDKDAKFGRGAGGKDRGYKLHAIYSENDSPVAFKVTPLNENEAKVACELVGQLDDEGYLVGDRAYDHNALYDAAARNNHRHIARRRYRKARGVGHHRHSEHRLAMIARLNEPTAFMRHLLRRRTRIESRFASLTNFGGGLTHLPPWVRGLPRVTLWVWCKLMIRLARSKVQRCNAA